MKFAKDRNLVDFTDRKDKDDTPKKEWAPTNSGSKVLKFCDFYQQIHFHSIIVSVLYCTFCSTRRNRLHGW